MPELNQELAKEFASREFILAQTDIDEHLEFIRSQIVSPFENGEVNHFRKMMKLITDKAQRQEYAKRVLEIIDNEYSNIDIDIEDFDRTLVPYAEALYKFFGKNLRKLVTTFLREYLYNNKNRKALLSSYQDLKLASYPKEQFGKKDNYILIIKLAAIVKDITELPITAEQFIQYCIRNDDKPQYIDLVEEMLDDSILIDYGIYSDIMDKFMKSDAFDGTINKLQTKMIDAIVRPSVSAMGYDYIASAIDVDDDDPTDEDDEDPDAPQDIDETPMRIDDFEED